jgi:AMME syndrome candidate gene 1 protein
MATTAAAPAALDSAAVQADKSMCAFAFDVVCSALGVPARGAPSGSPERFPDDLPDASGVGVFVTFNERTGTSRAPTGWTLRGCIGTLAPTDLRPALRRYASYSAFEDSRFDAITAAELPNLQAAVSVLSDFKPAAGGVYDWTVGVHGIILSLRPSGGGGGGARYSATYLPEVCAEQGWSKEECIASLAQKAGFRGRLTSEILESAELTTYVSTKAALSYASYLAR